MGGRDRGAPGLSGDPELSPEAPGATLPASPWWADDRLLRLPFVVYCLGLAVREGLGLSRWIAGWPPGIGLDPALAASLAARVTLLLFLLLLSGFQLTRYRPIAVASGWAPWLAAGLGTTLTLGMVWLPRVPGSLGRDLASSGLILAGNYLAILALLALGRSLSLVAEARVLVTSGPYRWIRHPLYLAEEIAILGIWLQFQGLAATILVVIHAAIQLKRMGYEEVLLTRTFPAYADYARRTARLVPGLY